MLTSKNLRKKKVLKHNGKKAGSIKEILFAPQTRRVVGFIVERGDLLLMIERKDRFLALDRVRLTDDAVIAAPGRDVWDEGALKRLDCSYDDVIVWRGMPVRSEDGREIGQVSDLAFSQETGQLLGVRLSDGALATTLLGRKDIDSDLIVSCDAGGVVVKDAAVGAEASGGLVDSAATATAYATDRIQRGSKVAVQTAAKGVSAVKKRTGGMFAAFKEEYEKGLRGESGSSED